MLAADGSGHSSLDASIRTLLAADVARSREGLSAFLQGRRRLRKAGGERGNLPDERVGHATMTARWHAGNAARDGSAIRGWLLGHFISPADGVRHSTDVEVKWATHPAGDQRPGWTAGDQRTTLVLLIQGRFRLDLTGTSITLAEQGDYVLWGPGIDHSWQAVTDSTVVTVRWPSRP